MKTSEVLKDEVSSVLHSFGGEPGLHSHLTRSIFDVKLGLIVAALALRDEEPPLLAANALRPELVSATTERQVWRTSLNFLSKISSQVLANPEEYAKTQTSYTRNAIRFDEARKKATGMLFHGTDENYSTLRESASYGLKWALERWQQEDLDLSAKIVGTFAVRNVFNSEMRGDYANEIVQPALVFNSAINAALIHYDLQPDPNNPYEALSRNFLIKRTARAGHLSISEHLELKSELHGPSDIPEGIGVYRQVGEIQLRSDECVSVEAGPRYRELVHELLAD